jgi:glutathione S-transferase
MTVADTLILHHHDPSPFAEKIRLVFGIKRLAWASVRIPMAMPKPDLVALTGGYRGTPVLQIGADIYCDSRLIVAEIERRYPDPPLLRSGPLVNFGLQHWSDDAVFSPGAALAMHEGAVAMPDGLIEERSRYFTNLDFTRFAEDDTYFRAQLVAHIALIERQLSDGRPYLLGDQPEWADVGAYFPLWMLAGHVPSAPTLLRDLPAVAAWRERLAAFGTGDRVEIDANEAIAVARAAPPSGKPAGERVSVFPVAHPETAVTGSLLSATVDEIVIHRTDDRAGAVRVHFPTIGYRIDPAG